MTLFVIMQIGATITVGGLPSPQKWGEHMGTLELYVLLILATGYIIAIKKR